MMYTVYVHYNEPYGPTVFLVYATTAAWKFSVLFDCPCFVYVKLLQVVQCNTSSK